jgi:hypothetical protein
MAALMTDGAPLWTAYGDEPTDLFEVICRNAYECYWARRVGWKRYVTPGMCEPTLKDLQNLARSVARSCEQSTEEWLRKLDCHPDHDRLPLTTDDIEALARSLNADPAYLTTRWNGGRVPVYPVGEILHRVPDQNFRVVGTRPAEGLLFTPAQWLASLGVASEHTGGYSGNSKAFPVVEPEQLPRSLSVCRCGGSLADLYQEEAAPLCRACGRAIDEAYSARAADSWEAHREWVASADGN